jgi:hypothetical protein
MEEVKILSNDGPPQEIKDDHEATAAKADEPPSMVTVSCIPQSSCVPPTDAKTDYIYLKKVFVAAGRNMYKTFQSLTAVQRCAQLDASSRRAQDSNRGKRTTGKPHQQKNLGYMAMPRMPIPWCTMAPYQQQMEQLAYYQSFQQPTYPRFNARNPPSYMQPMLPPRPFGDRWKDNTNTRYNVEQLPQVPPQQQRHRRPPRQNQQFQDIFPGAAQSALEQQPYFQAPSQLSYSNVPMPNLSSSSCTGFSSGAFPQFCSAVPAPPAAFTPPPPSLIGSVGSRDSQQLLQQHAQNYYQNCAQQYAQVYAQQYAQEYVRLLVHGQQAAAIASQLPAVPQQQQQPQFFQEAPQAYQNIAPPRVYTNTPSGPQLQKQPKSRMKRNDAFGVTAPPTSPTQSKPLANVAAQLAQRPQGTTFHFAITDELQ